MDGRINVSDKQLSKGMEKFMEKHQARDKRPKDMKPDWAGTCENCGASPIVPLTGMCGPCTFGEAETAGGNW
jgi:hypothetical protein